MKHLKTFPIYLHRSKGRETRNNHQDFLSTHLAQFFASKNSYKHVQFFSTLKDEVISFASLSLFQKLYDESAKDSLLIPLDLYVDAFPMYKSNNSQSAVGVYTQSLNLDPAFTEAEESIFLLSTIHKDAYTLQQLLKSVLSEIEVGESKGFYVYHAGLKRFI